MSAPTTPTCSVGDLPPNILRQIFAIYRSDCRADTDRYASHSSNIWMRVALICQEWRSIALDYAELWCTLRIRHFRDATMSPLSDQLERTKDLPLDITLYIDSPKDKETISNFLATCMLMAQLTPRLKLLEVGGEEPPYVEALLRALTGSADELTSFTLGGVRCEIPDSLFAGGTPKLQHLQLEGCGNIPWSSNLFRSESLSELGLRKVARHFAGDQASFPHLHQQLRPLANTLTTLQLDTILPHTVGPSILENVPTLHLPNLRDLSLCGRTVVVSTLLRSLKIPPSAKVHFDVHVGGEAGDAQAGTEFNDTCQAIRDARSSNLIELTDLSIHSRNWQGTLPLWVYGWGGDAIAAKRYRPYMTIPIQTMPIFSFTFEDPRYVGVGRSVISFFPNTIAWPCLSLVRLQSLELKATRDYLTVPPSVWDSFSDLPKLTMLRIENLIIEDFVRCMDNDSAAIEDTLQPTLAEAQDDSHNKEKKTASSFPRRFAALKCLFFKGIAFYPSPSGMLTRRNHSAPDGHPFLDRLLKNFQLRQSIGVPLESIDFGFTNREGVSGHMLGLLTQCVLEVNGRSLSLKRSDIEVWELPFVEQPYLVSLPPPSAA
ncbi:hypothetical protein EST38_g13093 [Candolleomyces aberdarensis]|uniref:Uncharacterized protein n=1 Tax=Candolleomyces aberdarensis TaxID=2316362 RepID=A0A4Q2D0T6_9AGAR|nr:hypothetical protein EST38_g13093 [Candolleomyces aberdarensis]